MPRDTIEENAGIVILAAYMNKKINIKVRKSER
jgi:hypothetical protein